MIKLVMNYHEKTVVENCNSVRAAYKILEDKKESLKSFYIKRGNF